MRSLTTIGAWATTVLLLAQATVLAEPQLLLVAGHSARTPADSFLAAVDVRNGKDRWQLPLPADAVPGGVALDHLGRIFVALENGQLYCYGPER